MKKLTVTVATSAFNEAQNIKQMLTSVLAQKETNFVLREILVVSDGSTDDTVFKAKSVQSSLVHIFDDGKRLGQPVRYRQILKRFAGDVLVFIDSDFVLKHDRVIEHICRDFLKRNNVGLVAGHPEPEPAETFVERAFNNYINARSTAAKKYPHILQTGYGAHAFVCLSKQFARTFSLPKETLNSDTFFYLMAQKKGFAFVHEFSAPAYYRNPQTIREHIKQALRHRWGGQQLADYFSSEAMRRAFLLNSAEKLAICKLELLHNPIAYAYMKLVEFFLIAETAFDHKHHKVQWDSIQSSKKIQSHHIVAL
ncbi:glycosyltransferase [Candidatus Microgenomates bacterium]|nr:MAG: glycosyltransferase [Candidatus Microgenomates bacterium]